MDEHHSNSQVKGMPHGVRWQVYQDVISISMNQSAPTNSGTLESALKTMEMQVIESYYNPYSMDVS